jgi:Protein tyrosine and serine/threonine kinase/Calpain large subunit, domain III
MYGCLLLVYVCVCVPAYIFSSSLYIVHCKASYPAGVYHIIPCTFEPKQEGIFQVTVFSSSSSFELEPVDFVPLEPMLSGGFQAPSTSGPDEKRKLTQRTTSPLGKFSISWADVTVGKKIGQGGYGAVYRGTWQGKDVAIKKLFREELTDEADVESFRKEIEIMK